MFNIEKATNEQKQVLDTKNRNILVSAAAGSGKTTVMIEKIVQTMLDTHTPIENFLVLTFTKASASDMKNKLSNRLASEKMSPFVLNAMDSIAVADIATIHSFCARVLKSYFYEIGLDPTFSVIEELEQNKLKNRALDKLFNEEAEKGNYDFFELADIFSNKRKDDKLREQILKLYDFSKAQYNYDEWFQESVQGVYDINLDSNKSAKIIKNYAKNIVNLYKNAIFELKEQIVKANGDENEIKKLIVYLDTIDTNISQIRYDLQFEKFVDSVVEFGGFGRIPSVITTIPEFKEKCGQLKEEIASRIKTIKLALTSSGDNSTKQIQDALLLTKNRVVALNGLMKRFEEIYSELKKELGVLDFNDLEMNTIKVLESEDVLKSIKQQYKYIFVDEYQDINSVQETIISKIAGDNNRFMVGDVKQSIYGFRLCDPDIFLEKYSEYKNSENSVSIDLNKNFRSHKDILCFVNMVFDNTMTKMFGGVDYKNNARFVVDDNQSEHSPRVSLVYIDSSSLETKEEDKIDGLPVYSVKNHSNISNIDNKKAHIEGLIIANKIQELVDSNIMIEDKETKTLRKIEYDDIVLLVQSRNEYLNDLLDVLDTARIPISSDITSDVFEDQEVLALKNMLLIISNMYNDKPLFSLMRSSFFNFSPDELAEIRLKTNAYYFYGAVELFNDESSELFAKITAFKEKIALYKKLSAFLMVKDLCNRIISDFNIREYMLSSKNAPERFSKLNKFLSSLPDVSLEEFLLSSDLSNIESQSMSANKSVRVMTIHKSKGLEFPVVFLIGTGNNFNMKSIQGDVQISKKLGVGMKYFDDEHRYKAQNMPRVAASILENKRFFEEEQRLLYVGLTRAIDYLFVTGVQQSSKLKDSFDDTPKNFMEWFAPIILSNDNQCVKVEKYDASTVMSVELAKDVNDIKIGHFDNELLQNLRKKLSFVYPFEKQIIMPQKTSITKIVNSSSIVTRDEYNHSVSKVSSSVDRGTLYHKILENMSLLETDTSEIKNVIEKLQKLGLISENEASIVNVEQILRCVSNPEFANLIEKAKEIHKEMEFYMLVGDGPKADQIEVQGVIDLLLDLGDELCIVDYKTGSLDEETAKNKYSMQLEGYKTAAQKITGKPVGKMFIFALDEGKLFKI